MDILLEKSELAPGPSVVIPGSKSETNRLLLLQALFPQLAVENPSDSDDSRAMRYGLKQRTGVVDVGHAGTAMRFLTAYFAATPGAEVWLTGSGRMKQRPIGILVAALRELGANVQYAEAEGFPPLKISGRKLRGGRLTIDSSVSSQFLSALLLVAPMFENGLELAVSGSLTSRPYLDMTLSLLREAGIGAYRDGRIFVGTAQTIPPKTIVVESDWSSASYYFSLVALSPPGTDISLLSFRENSLQGDRRLTAIYQDFGVETHFGKRTMTLRKSAPAKNQISLNLNDTPDIAQTIAVTALGLGIGCDLSGLHTLRIKETDRLSALKAEMEKFGASVAITNDTLVLRPAQSLKAGVSVATYHDHRMAMAFAPLALKTSLTIGDAAVVSKSYPDFWIDLQSTGIKLSRT